MAEAHKSSLQLMLDLIERLDGLLLWLVRVPELYSLGGGLGVESALNATGRKHLHSWLTMLNLL